MKSSLFVCRQNGEYRIRSDKGIATDIVNSKEKQVILKAEQELAVKSMLEGKDVLAVLPTGFGKSMIFTIFGIAKKNIIKSPV